MWQNILTFDSALVAVGAFVAAAVWAYRTFSKQSAETKLARLLFAQDIAVSAWHFVEGIASGTSSTVDDKLSLALKRVAETFAAQTGKPIPPQAAEAAKLKMEGLAGAKAQDVKAALVSPLTPP